MPLILWLKGSLTHWILWNLTVFSNSESQAKLMFSWHISNEDRLFIPTRKVFNFIHSIFLKENKMGFFLIRSIYSLNQDFRGFICVSLLFHLLSFSLRASLVRGCVGIRIGSRCLWGKLIWWMDLSSSLVDAFRSFFKGLLLSNIEVWNSVLQKKIHRVLVQQYICH